MSGEDENDIDQSSILITGKFETLSFYHIRLRYSTISDSNFYYISENLH